MPKIFELPFIGAVSTFTCGFEYMTLGLRFVYLQSCIVGLNCFLYSCIVVLSIIKNWT